MMATVKIKYRGDLRVECEHVQSGTKLYTDAPTDNQGKGESFSPTDLCVTSLAACMMTAMGLLAKTIGEDISGTEIEVVKKMEADPLRRIGAIDLVFLMPDREYSDKHKIAMERAARACAVHRSLSEKVIQHVEFIWKNKTSVAFSYLKLRNYFWEKSF